MADETPTITLQEFISRTVNPKYQFNIRPTRLWVGLFYYDTRKYRLSFLFIPIVTVLNVNRLP